MNSNIGSWVLCPFYIGDSDKHRKVRCEGPEEGSITSTQFADGRKLPWMAKYCCEEYTKCPIYTIAREKYNE